MMAVTDIAMTLAVDFILHIEIRTHISGILILVNRIMMMLTLVAILSKVLVKTGMLAGVVLVFAILVMTYPIEDNHANQELEDVAEITGSVHINLLMNLC